MGYLLFLFIEELEFDVLLLLSLLVCLLVLLLFILFELAFEFALFLFILNHPLILLTDNLIVYINLKEREILRVEEDL